MKQIIKAIFIFHFSLFTFHLANAQLLEKETVFTHADTLRGSNGPGRDWWDVLKYHLDINLNIQDNSISGIAMIDFNSLMQGKIMQIDLQEPLIIDSFEFYNKIEINVKYDNGTKNVKAGYSDKFGMTNSSIEKYRQGSVYFLPVPDSFFTSTDVVSHYIKIFYHGKPTVAIRPPWDGGIVWAKDKNNSTWVSIACQGLGASVWYPCKDHQGDEPDEGATLQITVPDNLIAITNGRFLDSLDNEDGTKSFLWEVKSPINSYNIIPYIGKYTHFDETYDGEKGKLDLDYWVLEENLAKAKKHFKDAPRTMKALEYWFGPYPFYEDGYKLVDAPYLGMEHQSAIAYGNGYQNGYLGGDRSGTGWGLKWDFIIVHESGHEWFGNNITTKDIADMWVHEAFTTYSEVLFTEYYYGKEAGNEYCIGLRNNIQNDIPIIGPYGVNKEGSGDMYDKGANMIHNVRQIINNDSLFRKILRGLNKEFYHQTVTTKQIEDYISTESKIDLAKVFDQYLRTIQVPVLEYKLKKSSIVYRWSNCLDGFNMPVRVKTGDDKWELIHPSENWQTLQMPKGFDKKTFNADPNFYINTKKVD